MCGVITKNTINGIQLWNTLEWLFVFQEGEKNNVLCHFKRMWVWNGPCSRCQGRVFTFCNTQHSIYGHSFAQNKPLAWCVIGHSAAWQIKKKTNPALTRNQSWCNVLGLLAQHPQMSHLQSGLSPPQCLLSQFDHQWKKDTKPKKSLFFKSLQVCRALRPDVSWAPGEPVAVAGIYFGADCPNCFSKSPNGTWLRSHWATSLIRAESRLGLGGSTLCQSCLPHFSAWVRSSCPDPQSGRGGLMPCGFCTPRHIELSWVWPPLIYRKRTHCGLRLFSSMNQ